MNNTTILFYSKKCIHSQKFLKQLYKNQELYNNIFKVSIEEPSVKIPRNVKSVPTLIIKNNNNFITYVGDEVFEWFRSVSVQNYNDKYENSSNNQVGNNQVPNNPHKNNSQQSGGGIQCYDPIAMSGGFSDSFSNITDASPMGHCYEFLHGDSSNKINTAKSNFGEDKSTKENVLNNDYERMLESRNNDQYIRKQIQRQ